MANTIPSSTDPASDPNSPERTDFAQDMLASINAVAQPSSPVEMHALNSPPPAVADPGIGAGDAANQHHLNAGTAIGTSTAATTAVGIATTTNERTRQGAAADVISSQPAPNHQQPMVDDGIGPATDRPPMEPVVSQGGLQLVITLLLHATDTRHKYVIDEGYLTRRNIEVEGKDPLNMSVYTLKELIMRDWRPEWKTKPASPSSIRLIHMGRMLEDKWYLKDARFTTGPTPHIVHMSIKPQEVVDEEDARMAKGGRDGATGRSPCRCTVM